MLEIKCRHLTWVGPKCFGPTSLLPKLQKYVYLYKNDKYIIVVSWPLQ